MNYENTLLTSAKNYLKEFGEISSLPARMWFSRARGIRFSNKRTEPVLVQRLPLLFKPSDPPFLHPLLPDRLSSDDPGAKVSHRTCRRSEKRLVRRSYASISHINKVSISRRFDVLARHIHIHIHVDKIYTHIDISLRHLHRAATSLRGSILLKRETRELLSSRGPTKGASLKDRGAPSHEQPRDWNPFHTRLHARHRSIYNAIYNRESRKRGGPFSSQERSEHCAVK